MGWLKRRTRSARGTGVDPTGGTTPSGADREGGGTTLVEVREDAGGNDDRDPDRPAHLPPDPPVDLPVDLDRPDAAPRGRLDAVRRAWPVLLLRAAHPRQAALTALALGAATLLSGRATREALVVLATVLVGQAVAGWHNDLVDRGRDSRHRPDKPLVPVQGGAGGQAGEDLDPGTVWFSITVGVLLVVPLSISTGVVAGLCYLLLLAVTLLGNVALRRGRLSWVPWAVSFALYPAYLSYGGWGGDALGPAPSVVMTFLAAGLGVTGHLLRSTSGLVADHQEGWRTVPVRLGLRLGANRLLLLAGAAAAVLLVIMAAVGSTGGLSR